MKKNLILSITILFLITSFTITTKAASKREVPYEINDITINKRRKRLEVQGWGFITDAQNYKNKYTHAHELHLETKESNLVVKGKLRNISHTQTMSYAGSRMCLDDEFNKSALICNNMYDKVGFTFYVPLSKLEMDKDYKVSLKVFAKTANISKKIPIYFPVKEKLVLKNNQKNYIVDSKLNDMTLKVIFDHVLVREEAKKSGKIINTKLNCSRKHLYFKKNTRYFNIFDKVINNNTTYYKLSAKEDGCASNFALVSEGSDLYPVWIASNFVDYDGQQLSIKTRYDNNAPIITVKKDSTIYVDEHIDFFENVTAYDQEDGDITDKIEIINNNFKNEPGSYVVEYTVKDKDGKKDFAIKNIIVLKRNYPPQINANDIEIKQYSKYNPMNNVSAFDQDNTDITSRVKVLNEVDTSIIKNHKQCFFVTDKYNLTAKKCINVNVVERESNFRFIDKNKLFYLEQTPIIWKSKINRLNAELKNEIAYLSLKIKK